MPSPDAAQAFLQTQPSPADVKSLAALWEHANATWPRIGLSAVDFFEALGDFSKHEIKEAAALRVADVFLAVACLHNDAAALTHFETAILPRARPVITRLGDRDFQDEALQRLRGHLLLAEGDHVPRLRAYGGRGSLLNWVRSSLVRLALTMKRLDHPAQNAALIDVMPEPGWSAELQFIRLAHREAFAAAFSESLATLDENERAVLRLNLVHKLNIEKIGAIYGVHRATVARWVSRARARLIADVEGRLRTRLSLTPTEYEAMMRSLQENLEVSLQRLISDS